MNTYDGPIAGFNSFRSQIHASFALRADALSELIDALPCEPRLTSAVQASLAPVFRRRHCSVPDALNNCRIDREPLRQTLIDTQAELGERVGGYEVFAIDITNHPRPDAVTAKDRGNVYSAEYGKPVSGWQFCWLGRVLSYGQSWFAPLEVDRIPTDRTPAEVAAGQVRELAKYATADTPKVVVADSGFRWPDFLHAFEGLSSVYLLMRIANNRVLYGPPPPANGKRGHPVRHGAKFHLSELTSPERHVEVRLLDQAVQLSAWHNLHFKQAYWLPGTVVRVVFLKPDGSPRHERPLWLFWKGPGDALLEDLALVYLMRFIIEHFFRFCKQFLGLQAAHSSNPDAVSNWVWVVALAYWQLLLARSLVVPQYHDWDPQARRKPTSLTPGQVLHAWIAFMARTGSITDPPRPAGKPPGRVQGVCPRPRQRYPVVRKTPPKPAHKARRARKKKLKASESR